MREAVASQAFLVKESPRLKFYSTVCILLGALGTYLTIPGSAPEPDIYRYCAYSLGGFLFVAFCIEAMGGARAVARVDLLALFSLYVLTFAEFLAPVTRILYDKPTGMAVFSCELVLIGFACLAIGRHFPFKLSRAVYDPRLPDVSISTLFYTFIVLFLLGEAAVLISVRLNIFEALYWAMQERFVRPWQRSAIGGWSSFLTELDLLLYPAFGIAGYLMARARDLGRARLAIILAMTFFAAFLDFTSGTRNVFLIRVLIFTGAYFIANRNLTSPKVAILGVGGLGFLWVASDIMLRMRSSGLGAFLEEGANDPRGKVGFMLDNNLISIARTTEMFPNVYPFPGWDIVIQVFTKWVPRALWPSKPIGWENSLESVLGIGNSYTLAVTYVGEAYLIAGIPSLIVVSLLLGSLAGTWNRVGMNIRSNLDLIYYCSGFLAATLAMRSIQFMSVTIVPLVAFYFIARALKGKQKPPRLPAPGGLAR